MQIYKIKHKGLDVVQVFRDGVMLFGRKAALLLAKTKIIFDSKSDLNTSLSAHMEQATDTDITAHGDLNANTAAHAQADNNITTDMYADLYAITAGKCAANVPICIDNDVQCSAPASAAGNAVVDCGVTTTANANISQAVPAAGSTQSVITSVADAAVSVSAPIIAHINWSNPVTVDATLTAVSSAIISGTTEIDIVTEAKADREITRYYTVRFFDGDTLLSEQQVGHGEAAIPPDTTKEGYTFVSWEPSNLTVTQDTDFYGTWEVGTDIVPRQTFTFTNDNMFGGPYGARYYYYGSIPKLDGIFVEWDGTQYGPLQAQPIAFTDGGATADCVGNRSVVTRLFNNTVTVTYPDTGEPFAVSWFFSYWRIATNSTEETHTVRIYRVK